MLPTGNPGRSSSIGRLIICICAALLAVLTAFALIRAGVFYSLYTWLFHQVVDITGFDVWASRAITLLALAVLWSLPWHLALLPWVGKAGRRAAIWFIMIALALASMEFITRDVYFSRADGRPLKFYIQTLDGYKFSATPDIDPVYGLPYQPITADVARKYMLWKERGGQMQDPSVPDGLNFNPSTGEPIRWYARTPEDKIEFFTLPGFHPKYGIKLAPATPEVITEYEKHEAEADRQKQEKSQRRRRTSKRRAMAAGKGQLEPGRYIPSLQPRRSVDGLLFTLTEVDLTAEDMLVHMNVENIGGPWMDLLRFSHGLRHTRLGILTASGNFLDYTSIRAKEGALAENGKGSFSFPPVGQRGAFVMDFARPKDLLTFSIVVNDQPTLTGINLRKAKYLSY
jgi:hypothetical protein